LIGGGARRVAGMLCTLAERVFAVSETFSAA